MNTTHRKKQQGGVSLFVVVFATLLMIIITISFVQLMLKDQRQATASDLSRSAYDSAQSGVEDAKRLLLLEQACRNNAAAGSVNCDAAFAAVSSGACNTVAQIFGDPNDIETIIEQNAGDEDLQQAYTCVKVLADTPDYKRSVELNQSNIIPLRGTGSFDRITVSWFTRADVSAATNSMTVGFPSSGPTVKLPRPGTQWDINYPALLRTQLMQTGDTFKLSDFNDSQPGNRGNANTLFLYPATAATGGLATMDFGIDGRRSPSNEPQRARCVASFTLEYACSVTINLPAPIDDAVANRNAFLRLSALYNGAHYKVELLNGGTVVPFDNVQPEVDSTGRANDMFRRVKTRIEFNSDFIYPEAAVDIGNDLCKNFVITDKDPGPGDTFGYNSPTCTP